MSNLVPELWVLVSLAAAFFQTFRFMLQKVLSSVTLSPLGATFARFLYSAPLVALFLAIYVMHQKIQMPALPVKFWMHAWTGGLAQVLATVCVVTLFKSRSFAVGVTLMKTEVILSVVVGFIILGEFTSVAAGAAIGLGLLGVLLLSAAPDTGGAGWRAMFNRGAALGLTSGALFAVSAVSYRAASLEVDAVDPLLRAGVTLAAVTGSQMIGMALFLLWKDKPQIVAVWRARRVAGWIGILSMAGSFCWFLAFTLQTAAYVKAVGQVELVFSLLASVFFFRERVSARELVGMCVICASILTLVLAT